MAKKIAASTTHLVLDIPVGKTMKIRHFEDAEKVGKKFKALAQHFNIHVAIDINETLEPAGRGVGPYLEARDVLEVLEQHKARPMHLEAKALRLAGKLLSLCFATANIHKDGEVEARKILCEGTAFKKFQEIVKAQGGQSAISAESFKTKAIVHEGISSKSGTIKGVNNYNLNAIAKILGAPEDKYAGIYLLKKLDEKVDKKESLVLFHSSNKYRIEEAQVTLQHLPIYDIN